LPYKYNLKEAKKQVVEIAAKEMAREMFREYDSYAVDLVIMASVISLIKRRKWGTGKRATRIHQHISDIEQTLREVCERYEPAFAMTALQMILDQYGIKYERKNGKDRPAKKNHEKKSYHKRRAGQDFEKAQVVACG
jgi:hypothetical protein